MSDAHEKQHAVIPLKNPREPKAGRRWQIFLLFGKNHRQDGKYDSHRAADDDAPDFRRGERFKTFAQGLGDGGPGLRGGRGKLIRADDFGLVNDERKREDADNGADENAGELRDKLFAWMRAEQVAAFQIGQQIGGGTRRPGSDIRAHQVHVHVAGIERAESELCHLAHRANGRGVGFAGNATRNESEGKGQHDGEGALPIRHSEGGMRQQGQCDERNELSGGEPGHRRFDGFHFAGRF